MFDVLPAPQKTIWNELSATPVHFTLYGGTAIALRLGHRFSVDFNFFSLDPFIPNELANSIPYLVGGDLLQSEANTLAISVDRNGPVKLAFYGGLNMGQVSMAEKAEGPAIAVASLLDLGGTKVAVVTQRAEVKDYLDIHALITQAKLPLAEMLSAAMIIYGKQFSPLISLKAITYHDDHSLSDLPLSMRSDLVNAAKAVRFEQLPVITPLRSRIEKP
jgi:hypothetical protein